MDDRLFRAIQKQIEHKKVEQSFLFEVVNDTVYMVHYAESDNSDFVDIPDEYYEKLEGCVGKPIDVHTHPNFNCIPSVLDIGFYLTNDDIREAYIIGKTHYSHITFHWNRPEISFREIDKVYLSLMESKVEQMSMCEDTENYKSKYNLPDGMSNYLETMATEISLELLGYFTDAVKHFEIVALD